jgi:membrane-associated protein
MIRSVIDFILHIENYLLVLIKNYGNFVYAILFLVIFVETGLVLTPFLPGDSLLFIAGTLAAAGALNVIALFVILALAAFLGDTANYWIGRFFGEKVFSRFIKPAHMERTRRFFDRYGKKTIVIARFVPIVRTFAPFVAGIGKMNYFAFISYNIIGGVVWVALFLFAGYFFGNIPLVKNNLKFIVILIIFVSILPMLWEYVKHRREKAALTKKTP